MRYIVIDQNGIPHREESVPDKMIVLAYREDIGDGQFVYFVMCSKYGDLFSKTSGENLLRSKTSTQEKKFDLRMCSKMSYDYYSTYLRSKNHRHFLVAERKLKNE